MKNKKFLILLTTTALIIAGCVLGVYLLNKPEKKSVAKNTTKKTEQQDKNKSSNSDTTDSENTSDKIDSAATKSLTMAEFKKKYPVGSKIKDPDGYTTIVAYEGDDVFFKSPDGTYGYMTGPLEIWDGRPNKE
jgi:PBP1b-binding outer membrane lipoprotein LpoB